MTKVNKTRSGTNDKNNKAFQLYNYYVRKYKKQYGVKGTMYSDDLERIAKKIFGSRFISVASVDTAPKAKSGQMAIINVSPSTDPKGSHWVALYKQGKEGKQTIYIYDSYSRDSKSLLPTLVKQIKGKGMKYVDSDRLDKEQTVTERNCAIRSISWLSVVRDLGIKQALKI